MPPSRWSVQSTQTRRGAETPVKDFFISYTTADKAWAEWIAWHLEEAGYSTVVQACHARTAGTGAESGRPPITIAPRRAYVVATAAPPVVRLSGLLEELSRAGWTSCVIATPTAAAWIDTRQFEAATGFPVRVHPRLPDEQDPLPPADAIVAAPLTFNTLNKSAAGMSDTLALGLLNEALGLQLPIVAAPVVKAALRRHPAYGASIATLRACGVHMLDPDAIAIRLPDGTLTLDWKAVVDELE